MQDLNINKPDFQYKDYIVDLLSLDMNIKDVRMIYDLKFLTPFIGLLISSFLYKHEYTVVSEIRDNGKKSLGYAKNNNFFYFAEHNTNFDDRNINYSGNYTPIFNSYLIDYYRGSDNIVENISRKISQVLSCGHDNVESVFFYIISEMIRNIPEHSHSFDAWHCSQRWDHGEYIEAEFALIDYGIGFKESLNFKGERDIKDDIEALKLALKPGVTSGITETSHLRENEEKDYLNSGYGLYIVTELCKKLQGEFAIISKGAIATKKKVNYLPNSLIFPGTAIKIKLKVPKNIQKEEFKSMLDEIITFGERQSRSIKGAISVASTVSRGRVE